MDEVLTRKMFKARYFKSLKPTIKHFKEGGLGSLTPQEKAIYAATFAAPLLKGKGKGLSSTLASLGEGLEKLPATILSVEKQKAAAKKDFTEVRQATAAEKSTLGYSVDDNINVKVTNGNIESIVSQPTAGERDKAADRKDALRSIDNILAGSKNVGTGPLSGRVSKIKAYLGFDTDAADLNIEIGNFRKSIIKALRGAQIGPAEEASFNEILPFITDPPNIIRAKMKIAKEKLQTIESRLNPNGTVAQQLKAEEIAEADAELFARFGVAFDLNATFDSSLDTFNLDGQQVK
jgi:uncharacterized membrane protein YdfJ with MMPL/SSD domain